MSHRYVYLGDRLTDPRLIGQPCDPVLRPDGKVVRAKNRNQLVRFADGTEAIVLGRRLRLTEKEAQPSRGPDRRPARSTRRRDADAEPMRAVPHPSSVLVPADRMAVKRSGPRANPIDRREQRNAPPLLTR